MRMNRIATVVMAGCAALAMSSVPKPAWGQTTPEHQLATPETVKPAPAMDAKCQAMMTEHDTMMADMKAADQRLDALVLAMNAASGMAQVPATVAVVTEMAAQGKARRDGMMKMQDDMMRHMMEHMQAGPASMAACPMMKAMGGTQH